MASRWTCSCRRRAPRISASRRCSTRTAGRSTRPGSGAAPPRCSTRGALHARKRCWSSCSRSAGARCASSSCRCSSMRSAFGRAPEVLVSAGGGAVGRRLLETAMLAREHTLLRGAAWRVLAGVNCSEADFRALGRLAAPGIVLERSREDFPALLANCALSISQAGYNTVAETLKARVRAVLVPFAGGGESEQTLRAQLLAERGAVVMLDESVLTVEGLAEAVNRAARAPQPAADLADLDGGRRSAELLREWLAGM